MGLGPLQKYPADDKKKKKLLFLLNIDLSIYSKNNVKIMHVMNVNDYTFADPEYMIPQCRASLSLVTLKVNMVNEVLLMIFNL